MRHFFDHLLRWIVRRLVRIYYPRIEVTGAEHVPRTGPVLLAANHANSLIDPVIVGFAAARPVRFFAKAPLFDTPGLGPLMRALGMLPAFRGQDDSAQVRRNLESLNVGAQALARGEAVGIFPEGKSHDSVKLEQIRSGAARMAVQAVTQENAGRGSVADRLELVPVGINYQRKQLFRSAIWVRIGRPIHVARFVARHDGERQAMRALTSELEARLKRVVLHLSDPSFEPFLDELELLLPPPRRVRGHTAISALRQRKQLADAMNWFLARDRSRAEIMGSAIREFVAHLARAGLTSRSPVMRFRTWRLFLTLTLEAAWLAFWFPAAAIGTLFHIVPFAVVRAAARKIQDGPTTTALSRLGLGLPVYGLWYAAAWWALRSYFLPWVAWTFVSLMPLAGALALSYAQRARDICGNWLRQMRVLTRPGQLRELRAAQEELRQKLQAFVAEYSSAFPSLREQPRKFSWRDHTRITLRWAAIFVAAAGIFIWQNWYFAEHGRAERMTGLNIAGLSTNSLDAALRADETALHDIIAGVGDLEVRTRAIMAEFASGQRNWYRQSDNDAVRALLLAYVNYRTALLRIIWKYQEYRSVRDEALRLRAFLASYTSASVLYETSLKFVTLFANAPDAIRKLNEAEPLWNIPPGLYDTVRRSLANAYNRALMRDAQAFYRAHRDDFARVHLMSSAPFNEFHAVIARAGRTIQQSAGTVLATGAATPLSDARAAGKEAVYRAQTFISTWIGDTKVREPRDGKALITPAQVKELRTKLKPGDVMLERRNWFLSNAFLPGYWPHSAIYVGTAEDIQRLGLNRDPRVQAHWREFVTRDEKGHERVIIEAISEGVVFTALEHSVGEADAAAFLRPNISDDRIREGIARAFSHAGKPYDFEFDFFSTDKLVCSEVVYRAYDGDIHFPLVDVMGRKTLPPIEIVRQCAAERTHPPAQFSFVAFLDGDEHRGRASFADENAFYKTITRSGFDLAPVKR